MRKKIIFLFLSLLVVSLVNAQQVDTTYVKKFKNLFSVKIFLQNNGFQYAITPQNNSLFNDTELQNACVLFTTNIPPSFGIAVNIRRVGFSYVFNSIHDYIDISNNRIKSDYRKLQFSTYGSGAGFEMGYISYSKFYINYKKNNSLVEANSADMKVRQFFLSSVFIKNRKRFSYSAAFNQSQFQKKSAGSFILGMGFKYNKIMSDDLIPDDVNPYFFAPNITSNKNNLFVLQPGYAFNIVKNGFYFSNALLVGAGLQTQEYRTSTGKWSDTGFPFVIKGKSGLGYNGKTFYCGLYANADYLQSSIDILKTEQFQYTYGIYVGLRTITKTRAEKIQDAKAKLKEKKEEKIETIKEKQNLFFRKE